MLNEIIQDHLVGPTPNDKYPPNVERSHVKAQAENNTATSQAPGPAEAKLEKEGKDSPPGHAEDSSATP